MKTKYKFVETTGCTAFDFSVNERPASELSNEELDNILDYLFVKVKEGINENTILFADVVKNYFSQMTGSMIPNRVSSAETP